jgi:hypothetical protein
MRAQLIAVHEDDVAIKPAVLSRPVRRRPAAPG